jgi:hypothetical protein
MTGESMLYPGAVLWSTAGIMKPAPIYSILFLACLALLPGNTLWAGEVTPVLLRYGFTPGQTNVYKLEIASQGESGREVIGGNFTVSCSRVGSNLTGLTFQGRLQEKNQPGMRPMMGFGPGNESSLISYARISQFSDEGRELVIDDRGAVLREAGDLALPIPLGQLMSSLVEKFPAEPSGGWEQEQDVSVLDEPLFQGPAGAFFSSGRFQSMNFFSRRPGQGTQGVLSARQKTKVRLTEVTPQTVRFEKTLSLDTYILTGTEPRISATSEGKFVFDRVTGWPKQAEFECKAEAVTENVSRRSVLTLRWEMLEGAEREAALAPPPPTSTEKPLFGSEKALELAEQMKSDDMGARQNAARELSGGRLGNPEPVLLAKMAALAADSDETVRHAALTVLANYGTSEQVPVLIKGLHDPAPGISATVIHGLVRLKDPRATAPLADFLASGQNDMQYYQQPRANETAEALIKIGPAAESPVLSVLAERNIEIRVQACLVLKQIGTKSSLAALKKLTSYPNKELSEAASDACRTIQERADK